MKFAPKVPPRKFLVGNNITLNDTGSVILESDEQITFKTEDGKEFDVCRKEWGFYATPSLNGRLKSFGFKSALVKNTMTNMIYVMLVEVEKLDEFFNYASGENLEILDWLDE